MSTTNLDLSCCEDLAKARPPVKKPVDVTEKQLRAVQEIYGMECVNSRWMAITYHSYSQGIDCCKLVRLADVSCDQWTFSLIDHGTLLAHRPDKQLVLRNGDFAIVWYGHGMHPDGGELLSYRLDGRTLEQFHKAGDRMELDPHENYAKGEHPFRGWVVKQWLYHLNGPMIAARVEQTSTPPRYTVTSNNK